MKITPLHILLVMLCLTLIVVVFGIIFITAITSSGLPSLYELENPKQQYATQIISADGEVLDHFFKEKRVPLTYSEIPKDFVNALIATEDRRFWSH
jgi:penicillin-binding protein 1A